MKPRHFAIVPLSLSLLTVLSCKKESRKGNDHELAALDNFAGGDTVYDCHGGVPVSIPPDAIDAPIGSSRYQDVLRALSAVPTFVQDAVFTQHKAKIKFSELPLSDESLCPAGAAGSASDEYLMSCFRPDPSGQDPVIFVKADSDANVTKKHIQHALIRSVGEVFSRLILDATPPLGGTSDYPEIKRELAARFLSDMATKGLLKADSPLAYLGPNIADPNKGLTFEQRSAAISSQQQESSVDDFTHIIVVESLHSYLCTSDSSPTSSRSVMARDFPDTYRYFLESMAQELQPADGSSQNFLADAEVSGGGMGLWFPGARLVGWMGRGLRNWGQFRRNGGGIFNFRRFADGGGFVGRNRIGHRWRGR